jgi:hypothetical protein
LRGLGGGRKGRLLGRLCGRARGGSLGIVLCRLCVLDRRVCGVRRRGMIRVYRGLLACVRLRR